MIDLLMTTFETSSRKIKFGVHNVSCTMSLGFKDKPLFLYQILPSYSDHAHEWIPAVMNATTSLIVSPVTSYIKLILNKFMRKFANSILKRGDTIKLGLSKYKERLCVTLKENLPD